MTMSLLTISVPYASNHTMVLSCAAVSAKNSTLNITVDAAMQTRIAVRGVELPEDVQEIGSAIGGKAGDALSLAEKTILTNYEIKTVSAVETGDVVAVPLAKPDADEMNDIGSSTQPTFCRLVCFTHATDLGPLHITRVTPQARVRRSNPITLR